MASRDYTAPQHVEGLAHQIRDLLLMFSDEHEPEIFYALRLALEATRLASCGLSDARHMMWK